jgi:hypothetical protein
LGWYVSWQPVYEQLSKISSRKSLWIYDSRGHGMMWFIQKIKGWHEGIHENVVRLCIQLLLDYSKVFSGLVARKQGTYGALDFGIGGNNKKVLFTPCFHLVSFSQKLSHFRNCLRQSTATKMYRSNI